MVIFITFPYILVHDEKSKRCFALTSDLLELLIAAEQQHHNAPICPSCCTTTEMQPRSDTVPPTSFSVHVNMVYTVRHHVPAATMRAPQQQRVQDAECFVSSREECTVVLLPRSCIYEHV